MSVMLLIPAVVHALVYACILLIILFRCIGVVRRPQFCFWFVAIYKFVFECLKGILEGLPAYETMPQLQAVDSILQATDTVIFLVVVSVMGRGYLPRNFIKITFFLYQLNLVLIPFSYVAYRLMLPYSEDSWQNALVTIAMNLISVAEVVLVSRLLSGWLDRLLQRISDTLCLIFFILACLVYLGKELWMLWGNIYLIAGSSVGVLGWYFLSSILLLSLALIAVLLFYGMADYRRFYRIQKLESQMMLDYYTSVSSLYQGVRQLKHDISNHLAAGGGENRYRDSMSAICDRIEARVARQTAWQQIAVEQLSAREKYELYQYVVDTAARCGFSEDALELRIAAKDTAQVLSFVLRGAAGPGLASDAATGREHTGRRKISMRRLRRKQMYPVIRTLAAYHGGAAQWKRDGADFVLEIRLGERG